MAFKTNSSVVYQIRTQHRAVEVLEVIPVDFAGVLVTDRFVTYDAKVFQAVKQHKCVSHILKNLRDLLEKPQRGRSHEFLRKLRAVFKTALRLHQRLKLGLLEQNVFEREGRRVKRRLDRLLAPRFLSNKNNARMLRELAWYQARGSLLRFLDDPDVSPTNNAAERALRPAVIARKLCAGSKSERGALAFSSFKSVIETGKLSGVSGFKTLLGVYEDKR
jgi:transposase